MSREHELISQYIDAYNQFDVDGLLRLVSDDIHFENIESETVTVSTNGKEALRTLAEASAQVFTARQQTITALMHNQNGTVAEVTFYGKLATDLPNGLHAGEEIRLKGSTEFAFSGEKISLIRDRC